MVLPLLNPPTGAATSWTLQWWTEREPRPGSNITVPRTAPEPLPPVRTATTTQG